MSFEDILSSWLMRSALVTLAILLIGSGAVLIWRQPLRRVRIIELVLAGCLIAPWLGLIPGYPQLSLLAERVAPMQKPDVPSPAPIEPMNEPVVHEPIMPVQLPDHDAQPDTESKTIEAPPHIFDIRHSLIRHSIIVLYLIGVTVCFGWWIIGVLALARLLWTSKPAPPRCRELLTEISAGRSDRVRLLVSRRLSQPFASAWGRAVIVLPENLCGDDRALRWCLAHEWAHVDGHDFRAWLLAGLARVLFFYQPPLWWLRRQLRLCQDFIADSQAALQGPQVEDYAEFLTARAAAGRSPLTLAGLSMGGRKSELYRRVIRLLKDQPLERCTPRLWMVSVTIATSMLVALVAAVSLVPRAMADEKPKTVATADPKVVEIAKLQLQGWKNARDALKSGVFRAHGQLRTDANGDDPKCEGQVSYYCAFDYQKQLFRFDHEIPIVLRVRNPGSKKITRTIEKEIGKYIATPTRSFESSADDHGVVYARGPQDKPRNQTAPFDIRLIGLGSMQDFLGDTTYEEMWPGLVKQKAIEAIDEGKGVWRIRSTDTEGWLDETEWFNQEMGYSPTHAEMRYGSHVPTPHPQESSDVTWAQVSGVWVPKSLVLERNINGGHTKIDLAFNWESVNQSVSELVFRAESLVSADNQIQVVAWDAGKPVVLEQVKSDRLSDWKPKSETRKVNDKSNKPSTKPADKVSPAGDRPALKSQPTPNHDPSQATFKARLANGVTVEMVGVSENPSLNRPWWRPDGSLLPERPYESLGYTNAFGNDEIAREFAVRLGNLPSEPEPVGTTWEVEFHLGLHGSGGWSRGNPTRKGASVNDLRAMFARVPAATKTLTMRFGLAAGPWHTLIKCGQQGNMEVLPGTNTGVIFAEPIEKSDKTIVAQVSYRTGKDQKRIVAVDYKGHEHSATSTRDPVAANVSQLTAVFSDLSLKEIKEFRFQSRPYQWVEFRNVSLQSGQSSNAQVKLVESAQAVPKPKDQSDKTSVSKPAD